MTIGIYKPFKKIFFHDLAEDYAAWSSEVTKLSSILADNGHEVSIISETDLREDYHPRIKRHDPGLARYDRIILFCGTFSLDKHGDNVINMLRKMTDRLDFIITDLSLLPGNKELLKQFDNIYSQATQPMQMTGFKDKYGGLIEITALGHGYELTYDEAIAQKTNRYVFGGSERNRLVDFTEYVYRPECIMLAKSDFYGFNHRVSRDKYVELMNSAIASICIADVHYNENEFITHRPIECFMSDTVCFTDIKFDPNGVVIPKNSWLRVSNYIELHEKITELENNHDHWKEILQWQRAQIAPLVDGSYVYGKLK